MSVISVAIAGLLPEFTKVGTAQDKVSKQWKTLAEKAYAAGLRAEHTENGSKSFDKESFDSLRLAFINGLDKKTCELVLRAGTIGMTDDEKEIRRKGMQRLGPMWLNCRKYLRGCEPAKERGPKADPVKKVKAEEGKKEKAGFDLRTFPGVKGSFDGVLANLAHWCEPQYRDAVENAVRAALLALKAANPAAKAKGKKPAVE